jgi:hypothetical protein
MRREKFKKARDWYQTGNTIKEMQVRTEPCDLANTVLKMGDKRALVGGVLLILGASEFFTCDVEDMPREYIETTAEPINAPAHPSDKPQAPQRKSAAPAPASEVKTAKGLVMYATPKNAGGYRSYALDGVQDNDGKDLMFSTKDETIIETLDGKLKKEEKAGIEYVMVTNGRFTNYNIVGLVAVTE